MGGPIHARYSLLVMLTTERPCSTTRMQVESSCPLTPTCLEGSQLLDGPQQRLLLPV